MWCSTWFNLNQGDKYFDKFYGLDIGVIWPGFFLPYKVMFKWDVDIFCNMQKTCN